jgi:predicted CoA-binding protein
LNTRQEIQDFVSQKTIAMAGLSRDENAFSSSVRKELEIKGYRILPINPNAASIGGEACYPSLSALPQRADAVLVVTPPAESEKIVREAAALGIRRVWLQQGSVSEAAIAACAEHGLSSVSGKCIMMFAEPVGSFHAVHRWFAKVFGRLPK